MLDMDGRTVLPGLWDAHVHAAQWAGNRHRVDLAGLESARAVAETVRLHAVGLPEDDMVMGQGFRDGLWPDTPHETWLDSGCPARPWWAPAGSA